MEKFRDLRVWQLAHKLTLNIYSITSSFPADEKIGLVSQMRRSALSVAANIVEGTKRRSVNDRRHFHVISDTSLEELKYYLILSADLGFINSQLCAELEEMCREIGGMLGALTRALKEYPH